MAIVAGRILLVVAILADLGLLPAEDQRRVSVTIDDLPALGVDLRGGYFRYPFLDLRFGLH